MKPKTLILMVVAVVCGLGASYMTSRLLAERNNQPQEEQEKVQVVVAKQKIPLGTIIKDPEKYFVWKSYVKGEEPKKAITNMDQVKDRRMNKPLAEEQFVTAEDLMNPKDSGIEMLLPQGMRAIALKVNAASVVGGFVLPNSHIDVVSTVRSGDDSFTQIILQNMLVLATDMTSERDPEKKAVMSSTVTVAAKPEDAQRLRMAESIGELSLILRGGEDDEVVRTKPIKPRDVLRSGDGSVNAGEDSAAGAGTTSLSGVPDAPATKPDETAKAPEKAPEAPPPPKTITQVLYNGESVTKTVFVLNDNGNVSTQVEKTGLEHEAKPAKKAADKDKETPPEPEPKKDKEPAGAKP